jgi:hypothetical protein
MGRTKAFRVLATMLLTVATAAASVPGSGRLRDILPAAGLVGPSVVEFRRQSALDPLYFLADEKVLGLDGKAEAVFARYRADGGEALVLAVAYPNEEGAARAHERFGRDFFSQAFDPDRGRFVEKLESGDHAGLARAGAVLVVVLEAPTRAACDDLLRRLEEGARALR